MDHRKRLARFHQLLHPATIIKGNEKFIRQELKELSLGNIPDEYRPATYLQLLNLSPLSVLSEQYLAFVDEISKRVASEPPPNIDEKPTKGDKLLREIQRDVERTLTPLAWFGAPLKPDSEGEDDSFWKRLALLDKMDAEKAKALVNRNASTSEIEGEGEAKHSEIEGSKGSPTTHPRNRRSALLRPLFIYATLNPGLSYVQGMNSLLAVFYWIFSSDPEATPIEAEAASFFALGAILSQLRDLYVPSLDGLATTSSTSSFSLRSSAPTGLGSTLARYTSLLNWLDPAVAMALEHKQVDPALYVFRWLTTWFANEFQLPDLVRIWDRIIALYPAEDEVQPIHSVSPVLGHLIDVSLAMVLFERPTLVSPYAPFQKVMTVLQDPQIGGEDVEKLLVTAWEIRERRLGRASHSNLIGGNVSDLLNPVASTTLATGPAATTPSSSINWRSAANKWASAASAAASTASSSPAANSLRSRWFSATANTSVGPTSSALTASSSPSTHHAADYDLDDTASIADSESSLTSIAPPLFASKGQHVGLPPTSSHSPLRARNAVLRSEMMTVDGRVLPPPPDQIDQRPTLAQLIEEEMPRSVRDPYNDEEDDEKDEGYGEDVDDLDDEGPTLAERAATSWGTLRTRFAASDAAATLSKKATNLSIAAQVSAANLRQSTANIGSTDSYAALSKTTTNLSVQAALLKEQIATSTTTDRLAKLKETVSGASERFMASTGSERGPRRPGSPLETPFTPPRFITDDRERPSFNSPASPTSSEMGRGTSGGGGPKPLLLSGAARRAANGSLDSVTTPSPPAVGSSSSRRSSIIFGGGSGGRSQSTSPILNRSMPRMSSNELPSSEDQMVGGRNAGSTSALVHGRVDSRVPALGQSVNSSIRTNGEDVPISSIRLQGGGGGETRRGMPSAESSTLALTSEHNPTSKRAENGRGWTLTDAPVSSFNPTSPLISDQPMSNELSRDRSTSTLAAPTLDRTDSKQSNVSSEVDSDESFHSVNTANQGRTPLESPELALSKGVGGGLGEVTDDVRNMFAAFDEQTQASSNLPSRGSSLVDLPSTPPPPPPPRGSSLSLSRSSGMTEEPFFPPSSPSTPMPTSTRRSSSSTQSPLKRSEEDPTDLDTPISPSNDLQPSGSRSKITRRPVISKRRTSARYSAGLALSSSTSTSSTSTPTELVDLSNEDRKIVSAFLAGEKTDNVGDLSRSGSRSSAISRKSRTKRESTVSTWSEGDILNSYGEDLEEEE